MVRIGRDPNWAVSDGYLTVWCPSCDRWLFRTTAIVAGAVHDCVCKTCGPQRFVTPAAALNIEQVQSAAA